MVRCSISGCKSDSERKITGLSFHSFPEAHYLRNIWIEATRRINWVPKPSSKICSEHFDRTSLWKRGKKTYLNPAAVPIKLSDSGSLHIDEPTCSSSGVLQIKVEDAETSIESCSKTVCLSDSASLHIDEPTCSSSGVLLIKVEDAETAIESCSETVCFKKLETSRNNEIISEALVLKKESKNTMNFPVKSELVYASSSPDYTPHTLKRKLKNVQIVSERRLKKLKALREKNRRLTKKVADLENVVSELKSKLLVSEEYCELLASIDTTNEDLLVFSVHE